MEENKHMLHFENITVVVHTKNRPKFLLRLIDYYQEKIGAFKANVIILDASTRKNFLIISKELKQREYSLRINVLHHSPSTSLTERFYDIFDLISTPYMLLAADDDLYLFDSWVKSATELLESDSSFGVVYGHIIRFKLKKHEPYGELSKFGWSKRIPPERWLEEDSIFERLAELGKSDWATVGWYALQRTEMFRIIIDKAVEYKLDGYHLEKFIIFCQAVLTKTRMLDCIFLARQDDDHIRGLYSYRKESRLLSELKKASSEILSEYANIDMKLAVDMFENIFSSEINELRAADSMSLLRKVGRRSLSLVKIRNYFKKLKGDNDGITMYYSLRDARFPTEPELDIEHPAINEIMRVVSSGYQLKPGQNEPRPKKP
ncbi:MAG: TIGR00180 family glycosyltransferase [Candidatus Electrothrix sp. GM3_4]|nr:TIGR00180 family glycosyltransferase [Candidatus Electrothrix sp. GM3_4]